MFTAESIAVILPSRGLLFASVMEAIEKERESHNLKLYMCHDKVIPDNLNALVDEALADKPTYIWFVEEDTVPPPGILNKMLKVASQNPPCVVATDYPLINGASSIWDDSKGGLAFCGFGCTLMHTCIFDKLAKPYFRTDKQLNLDTRQWITIPPHKQTYGTHDIWFFSTVREAGYKIYEVQGEMAQHLKIADYGKIETNKGLHNIVPKAEKIVQRYKL